MPGETVQQFIDTGDTCFWFCRECDHSRKLDMVRFREKFGPAHGALPLDIAPRLRCTRCKSPDIGLMRQSKGNQNRRPKETKDSGYAGPGAKWNIDLHSSGSCVYRLNAKGDDIEIVAWAQSSGVARAALEALRKANPDYRYQQRRRAWVESD